MKVGPLELTTNLCLSPLAGYTNLPFRRVVRELGGCGLATTDLVNARSLLENHRRALELVATSPDDRPWAVQLFGAVPSEMRDAAKKCEDLGANAVDINMGCPVRKVCKVGGGSAMMTELAKTAELVRGMVAAVKIPVTAKMRLGWDEKNLTAPDLARALEEAGISAIFVHGRTREQGFSGLVNLQGIAAVVRAVRKIPVIGNGDVTTPQGAKRMLAETGCQGVSVGRGAFYNPWIFRATAQYLETGELMPEPDFEERIRVMTRHLERNIEFFGEERGCVLFRKVMPWYARRFGPASSFKKEAVLIRSRADYDQALENYRQWRRQFLDEQGELRDPFQPAKLEVVFAGDTGPGAERSAIPVPTGPVEKW
ncbi:MAG: tRNA dihydrouridine synthase DusB [Verrucomicrobia bacterium]|nr:tRNA dihydrouridine synthase DusB [Verrucomicrobiota bacterium]